MPFPMVNEGALSQARTIVRYAPELAGAVPRAGPGAASAVAPVFPQPRLTLVHPA
jgi:hypothetical protein